MLKHVPKYFIFTKKMMSINHMLLYQYACDIKTTVVIQPSGNLFSEMWKEPENILIKNHGIYR